MPKRKKHNLVDSFAEISEECKELGRWLDLCYMLNCNHKCTLSENNMGVKTTNKGDIIYTGECQCPFVSECKWAWDVCMNISPATDAGRNNLMDIVSKRNAISVGTT